MEVRKDGTIRSAWALEADRRARTDTSKGYERTVEERYLDFLQLAASLLATVRFAAKAYGFVTFVASWRFALGLPSVRGIALFWK